MGDFMMLGLTHALVGYEAKVLGTIGSGGDDAAQAMIIIAFLCFTVAVILAVLQQLGDLQGNFIAQICTIVFILVAALFDIIGVAIWAPNSGFGVYAATLDCTSALMAIIAGVFFILCLTGTGGGGGGSGGKSGEGKSSNKTAPSSA